MPDAAVETTLRAGLEPAESVVLMENHDQAYYTWRDAGVKQRILVHIDAHHDMWWVKDKAPITIANFISPALREDIVREVFWVVPDAAWDSRANRKQILKHLKRIAKQYRKCMRGSAEFPAFGNSAAFGPGQAADFLKRESLRYTAQDTKRKDGRATFDEISLTVLGKAIRVCPLRSLPRIDEPVLLDIDTDYLVIPRVTYGKRDEHAPLPWCWPGELVARLAEHGIHSDLVTIVYSVEGGYTPLKWKYLGDEVAARLRQPGDAGHEIKGYDAMPAVCEAVENRDYAAAEETLQQAAHLLPSCAAPHFHLAHFFAMLGRMEEARKVYQRAVERDPSYRTAYSSAGFRYYWEGGSRRLKRSI